MIDRIARDIEVQGWSYQHNAIVSSRLASLDSLFETDFRPAKVGRNSQLQRREEIRGDLIKWLDPFDTPAEIKREIDLLNELKDKLNHKFYLGLKDFECHLAKYPSGSFYAKHSDRFEKDSSRSISFIFYLHHEWKKEDGGELVLYNIKNEVLKTILPEPGSAIFFMSEDFPHEVKICSQERRSLTGWMHTKILT